jgi:hypothetical protein
MDVNFTRLTEGSDQRWACVNRVTEHLSFVKGYTSLVIVSFPTKTVLRGVN